MVSKNMAVYMSARRERRRGELLNLAGNKCCECGSRELLEFNHRDRASKSFDLSGRGLDGPWVNILEEFKKCDLLCRDCHREYTNQQYAAGEIIPWNKGISQTTGERLTWTHGTARMYNEKACRCEPCKIAKRKYRNGLIGYNDVA